MQPFPAETESGLAEPPRARPLTAIMPAVVLVYSAMLPQEVRLVIGEQVLYAPRIVGLALLPWIVARIVRNELRLTLVDWIIFASCAWMITTFSLYYGVVEGMFRGVAIAIDVALPYLIARLTIRTPDDFRRLLILIVPGVFLAGCTMLAESAVGYEFVRPAAARIFGDLPDFLGGGTTRRIFVDYRYGLLRVAGPFSQPILAGTFMASLFLLYLTAGLRGAPLLLGLATVVFAFFSLSSAAVFLLFAGLGLLAYEAIQRRTTFLNWPQAIAAVTAMAAIAQFGSNRGLLGLAATVSFNPQTAYFRRLIWDYATLTVLKNPVIGIGYTPYDRPSFVYTTSVDHYWLALALRNGIPMTVLLFAAAVLTVLSLMRAIKFSGDRRERWLLVGLAASIAALIGVEFTFALFGVMQTWHYLLLGMGISLAGHRPA